jgi:phosphonoacetaldehyde hydrolase
MTAKLRAIIFDWAGTTVDYGSRAPALVFKELFAAAGIAITEAEAREPMGRAKHDHIATILAMPRVATMWQAKFSRPATPADVDRLYADFLPRQREVLANHSAVIPGVPDAVAQCRRWGLKIGATTGYTRALMDIVEPLARNAGYAPEVSLGADDAPAGRPSPWLILRACERLNVYPLSEVMIVDDTPVGIAAGRNAGVHTVAVTQTGNALGLSEAEVSEMDPNQLASRLKEIEHDFYQCGAKYVIRSVAELPALLREKFQFAE